jgi:RNA polymerase sigma-70 factor (ECF subfamily)
MTHERDEWLMLHAALGDQRCLEPLVRRYASPLLTFIRRMIGDEHRSEELFQDVFVAVWTRRKQYEFPRPFRAWLYAIAVNVCRAEFRRRRGVGVLLDDTRLAMVPAAVDPPGAPVVTTERAALGMAALAELPAQERVIVSLRTWSGLSYAEIADVLARAEVTVRVHMHNALARLREYLEPRLR